MDPLLRLLRYAAPYRLVIAGALGAMLLYGAASAALAWLVKPILDQVLPARESLTFVGTAIIVAYVAKGIGAFFSSYWMDDLGHRVVTALRTDLFEHVLGQSAAFFARRSTGQLLSRVSNDVGAGAAGGLGDRRRHGARVADGGRLRGAARLHRRRAGARLRHRGAAGRLSARPAGQAAAHGVASQPGGARAALAPGRRGLLGSPHRQGVPGRGPRGGEVPRRVRPALSHQHERHRRAVAAAAADGGAGRSGHRRRALVRQPGDCRRASHAGRVHLVRRRRCC